MLTDLVISGELHGGDDQLHVKQPRASVWDTYGPDLVRGYADREKEKNEDDSKSPDGSIRQRKAPKSQDEKTPLQGMRDSTDSLPSPISDSVAMSSNHSLMRVFSMLFAFR